MKSIVAGLFLFTFVACNSSPTVSSGSSSNKTINAEAPYLWGNSTFPKNVSLSNNFSADEVTDITSSSTAWKTAVSDLKTFYQYDADTSTSYNLDSPDGVLGIYKSLTWPADIDSSALAITQLFGRRYNIGSASEYVSIEHADIIVNFRDHTFYTIGDPTGDYDLKTVMVHEMGHFLGLQHIDSYWNRPDSENGLTMSAYKASSVMYPSISSGEEKRVPQTKDINELVNKYSIGGGGGAIAASSNGYVPQNNDQGKNIRILIELRTTGECIHKEDGAVIQRHHLKL